MTIGYWQKVMSTGLAVPEDRPLAELTAELTAMLGSPDPQLRDGIARPTLTTWIAGGTYDFLLSGLGDGIAIGLRQGVGESSTDSVFRRSMSAVVLGACLARDAAVPLVSAGKVLEWGDRLAGWFLREQDLRGWVPDKGWAHALAHGADALGLLADSRHLGAPELSVILDVMADRITDPELAVLRSGEIDRMAVATCAVLRRNMLDLAVVEPWVVRVAMAADPRGHARTDPFDGTHNAQAFLRSLYLHLALTSPQPAIRSDLLLTMIDILKVTNPDTLGALPGAHS